MTNTFSFRHVADISGGEASYTLYLDRWYAIDEDSHVIVRDCETAEAVCDALDAMNQSGQYAYITYTTDLFEFCNTAEVWVCTGQQFKSFYEENQ